MHIRIYRDRSKQWRWTVYARNGKKIATCGEGYRRRAHAIRMVGRLFWPFLPVKLAIRIEEPAR